MTKYEENIRYHAHRIGSRYVEPRLVFHFPTPEDAETFVIWCAEHEVDDYSRDEETPKVVTVVLP